MEIYKGSVIVQMVKADEGFSPRLYVDTLGFQTIGIGFCLDKLPMPEDVADYWCEVILEKRNRHLLTTVPSEITQTYQQLSVPRRCAILNMAYQMGVAGVCGFTDMWDCLARQDYVGASRAALDSVWEKQTPARARRIAQVIEGGSLSPYGL